MVIITSSAAASAARPQPDMLGTFTTFGSGVLVGVGVGVAVGMGAVDGVGVAVGAGEAVGVVHASSDAVAGVAVGSDREGIIKSTGDVAPTENGSDATGLLSVPTLMTCAWMPDT
jgi:hypothetical protein